MNIYISPTTLIRMQSRKRQLTFSFIYLYNLTESKNTLQVLTTAISEQLEYLKKWNADSSKVMHYLHKILVINI